MDGDTRSCPVCGEIIKAVALKCRFCSTDLEAFAAKKEYEIEKPLFSGHPAVFFSVAQWIPFLIVIVLALLVAYAAGQSGADGSLHGFYVVLGGLVVCGLLYLRLYLRSLSIQYTITTQRIRVQRGLLSQRQENLEMFRIDHFELRRPITWRLLGHARLHLFSSDAEFANFSIFAVPNVEALANTLRECQLRERNRRGLTTFVKA